MLTAHFGVLIKHRMHVSINSVKAVCQSGWDWLQYRHGASVTSLKAADLPGLRLLVPPHTRPLADDDSAQIGLAVFFFVGSLSNRRLSLFLSFSRG